MRRFAWIGALAILCCGSLAQAQGVGPYATPRQYAGVQTYAAPQQYAVPQQYTVAPQTFAAEPYPAGAYAGAVYQNGCGCQPRYSCQPVAAQCVNYRQCAAPVVRSNYYVGATIWGQPAAYVPGQPVRNFFRYLGP